LGQAKPIVVEEAPASTFLALIYAHAMMNEGFVEARASATWNERNDTARAHDVKNPSEEGFY